MERNEFFEKLKASMKNFVGIDVSENQCQQFFDFMNLLIEKNKVMNLTAIVDPDEIIIRHFVDSCMLKKFYDLEGSLILDLGTGAGFPGIPLAILSEKTKFVLTDTLGKRINFLEEVLDKIKLKNVKLVKARAEDFAHDKNYRESFDYVVARGVARISVLSEYCLPCVKVGGNSLSYKLDDCNKELEEGQKAINVLGGMFHVKHSYELVSDEPKRCVLEIGKEKSTPKQYPRKPGTPSKQPL